MIIRTLEETFGRPLCVYDRFRSSRHMAENSFTTDIVLALFPMVSEINSAGISSIMKPFYTVVVNLAIGRRKHTTDNCISFVNILLGTCNEIVCERLDDLLATMSKAIEFCIFSSPNALENAP